MADDANDGQERTEEATQHRREEWKSEGQVAQSREIGAALALLGVTGILYASAGWTMKGFCRVFEASYEELVNVAHGDFSIAFVMSMAHFAFKFCAVYLGPAFLGAIIVAVLSSWVQTGFVWSTKVFEFDLNKLNPITGFSRLASLDGLFDLGKAILKFIIVGAVVYTVVVKWVPLTGGLWSVETAPVVLFIGNHLVRTLFAIGLSMLLMAILDFAFHKFRYEQKIKMTKQEAREERKQQDGDPQIKARIRAIQRQLSNRRMMDAVKTADVVITNPTHIAVALIYDRDNMFAPRVVAKGADYLAEEIKRVARENGIPCVENVPLARAMFKALKIGQFISRDLYNAVAEVLAYVYRIKGKSL